MKKYALLLWCLSAAAMAETDTLPPVIDNSSYPESAPPPAVNRVNTPSSNALYDLMNRLDRLQSEVQQLTGKVEEQNHQISELKKQQSTLYADFDGRLQGVEKSSKATVEPAALAPVTIPVETTPPAPAPAVEPSISNTAPPIAPEVTPMKPKTVLPSPQQAEVQATGNEKQTFNLAYSLLRTGKTEQSIEQFKAYLSQYPTGGYADVANYWLGEAYRVKPDNIAARSAYNTVLEKFPNSAKAAEALLKLGIIEADEKNLDKARDYLNQVSAKYPNTPAAHTAAKKLSQLK